MQRQDFLPHPRIGIIGIGEQHEHCHVISMGCRVKLLAWDRDRKSPEFQLMEGVEVERVHLISKHGRRTAQIFFYAVLYLQVLWYGCKTPFEIVHCHDLDTLLLGYALGKIKRKPIMYDSHENFMDMLDGSVHPWVKRALMSFENFLIRRVDLLITVSEKLRMFLAERGARRTAVVGNWKILDGIRAHR